MGWRAPLLVLASTRTKLQVLTEALCCQRVAVSVLRTASRTGDMKHLLCCCSRKRMQQLQLALLSGPHSRACPMLGSCAHWQHFHRRVLLSLCASTELIFKGTHSNLRLQASDHPQTHTIIGFSYLVFLAVRTVYSKAKAINVGARERRIGAKAPQGGERREGRGGGEERAVRCDMQSPLTMSHRGKRTRGAGAPGSGSQRGACCRPLLCPR